MKLSLRAAVLPLLLAALVSCAPVQRRSAPGVFSHARIGPSEPAAAPHSNTSLRVLTLNIAHGRGDGVHQLLQSTDTARDNLETIALLLEREAPDVASLQEADFRSFWNGRVDQVEFLAQSAAFKRSVHGRHVDGMGLSYGTALIAKLELENPQSVTFDTRRASLPKGFVVSTVSWPDKACVEVDVVSVHLDFARESTRREQAQELIETLRSRDRPLIVMGDFNTDWRRPDSALRLVARELRLRAHEPDDAAQVTFPSSGDRLDWILVSSEIRFASYRVVGDVVSDHFGVLSDLVIERDCEYARVERRRIPAGN